MIIPSFLSIKDALYFHSEEMKYIGSNASIRDLNMLDSAINAPKASFGGEYLMNIFEMAATYINSICFNHPFTDGNKRVATICGLAFLDINGYIFHENNDLELANNVLNLVNKKISKKEIEIYLKKNCKKRVTSRRKRR